MNKREKKTVLRMLCIVGALYCCNLPMVAFLLHATSTGYGYYTVSYFYPWGLTILFLNSLLNPLILCYKNEHFRLY